jgi:hypothetical protein
MQQAAGDGYLVLVNISDVRSDATAVSKTTVQSIPLRGLQHIAAIQWQAMGLTYSSADDIP